MPKAVDAQEARAAVRQRAEQIAAKMKEMKRPSDAVENHAEMTRPF